MNISSGIDVPLKNNDTVCRVCLSSDEENKCIFTSHMTFGNRNSADLWEKLQFYGGIEVKQGDGLPSKMCEKCVINIRVAHDFRTLCQESDVKLRRLYRKVVSDGHCDSAKGLRGDKSTAGESVHSYDVWDTPRGSVTSQITVFDRAVKMRDNECLRGTETALTTRAKKSTTSSDDKRSRVEVRKCEMATSDELNKEEHAKEASKRLIVFRRITSMENLKNCKELQRRYLKKTKASRKNERDCEVARNSVGRRALERELAITRYGYSQSYEGDKSSKECRLSHAPDRFSRDHCEEELYRPAEFSEHVESHESKEPLEPSSCKICNKNFRKLLTMVRHLHAHKRENPVAVYAILRDIREKRRRNNSIFENENNVTREAAQRKRLSNVRIESSFRLDKSSVDVSESRKDVNFVTEAWNVDSNGTNETEFSDSSRAYDVPDESAFPSDDRSAIKLINIWIREELNSENEGKRFFCNICKRSYVTKGSLLKHKSKIHDDSPGRDTCSQYSIGRDKIRASRRKLEETKGHRCKDCEKSFENETKLAKHRKIHIRDNELEDKNFKRFLCHICSKTFRHNTGLMFHMRTHTGYKPHVCKYCGRGFTSNSNCTNHERTHTGDRPYVCHFCSAAFAKSCTLKAHITTHTGEANYHCKTCGKSFRRLKYLKEHCFTHTGEKPYACKICGTAYSHSGSLFVHEKKCKAQYDNCQVTTMGDYADGRTLVHPSNLAIDPAILSIPNTDNIPLNVAENGRFVNDARILDRANDNVHSSLPNGPSTVRNFIALGQIFQA